MATAFDFAGSAISDLFGAAGDASEAKAYGQASAFAKQNAQVSAESTALQQYQAQRQVYQITGAGQAAAAGNGLTGGGSAQDILRSSVQQGALQKQVIANQGIINENSYLEQADQYTGMQKAAKSAQGSGIFGGILNGIGAVASVLGFL